ncbi:MAG: hypothetical protein D6753_08910 [Planctomycetota bacterium]|nr:MAG: hypothetical protein D6753_08910 [Planctomycetota bacterium]
MSGGRPARGRQMRQHAMERGKSPIVARESLADQSQPPSPKVARQSLADQPHLAHAGLVPSQSYIDCGRTQGFRVQSVERAFASSRRLWSGGQ